MEIWKAVVKEEVVGSCPRLTIQVKEEEADESV